MAERTNQDLPDIPGTRGLPMIGDLPRLLPNPLPFLRRLHARFGNVFYARFAGNHKVVFALGPAASEQVLVSGARQFSSELGYADQSRFLGAEGVLFKDGADHAALRRAINPAFAPDKLQQHLAVMDAAIEEQVGAWRRGSPNLVQDIDLLTLRIAARTIMGVPIDADATEISRHIGAMLRSMSSPAPPLPRTQKWQGLKSRAYVQQFLRRQIRQRRYRPASDVFSCLSAQQPPLADEVIVDNMVGMLAASYETTASAIAMICHALASSPQWQSCMREELSGLLAPGALTVDRIRGCERTGWAFKESLRLHAPLAYFPRRTTADVQLEERQVPANTAVIVAPGFAHHMPTIYPEPGTFDPARFSPERHEDRAHGLAWMPFGKGAHTCAGMQFAQLEVFVFFARLLEQFRIEPADGRLHLRFVPVLKPYRPLPIRLVPLRG